MKEGLNASPQGAIPEPPAAAAPGLRRFAILEKIAHLFSGSAAAQGLTALTLLITARQLGLELYGQYTLCFALAGMLSVLFDLGSDHLLLRDGGRLPARLGLLAGSTLGLKTALGLAWLGLFALLGGRLDPGDYPYSLLLISAGAVLADHLLQSILTAFKASLHTRTVTVLDAGSDGLWLLGTLLLIGSGSVDPRLYAWVRLGAALLGALAGLFLLWRRAGLGFSRETAQGILRQAPPFAASDALSLASMRQDLLIIGFVLGDAAAGLYSPAVNLVNALFLAPMAVYSVMVPILGRLYATDEAQARRSSYRMILLMAVLGVALSAAFYVGAPLALVLLGKSYTGVTEILRILSLVLLFKCGSFAMAAIIIVTGRQTRRTLYQVFTVAVNAVLNLLVAGRFGVVGVAWVYVFTEVLVLAGYSVIALRGRTRAP